MPLIQTKGAASAQGFGEFARTTAPVYIEDVFSTYLYTGNGSTQTITNSIDLSTKGGLVWIKGRSNPSHNFLNDTVRGAYKRLKTNATDAEASTSPNGVTAFNSSGFSIAGTDADYNTNTYTFVSWTFRKQTKFFDVVTYTGNGGSSLTVNHNLGSVPGCIIAKRTDSSGGWAVWHRGNGTTTYGLFALNSTAAATANFSAAPTSTTFDAYNIWDTGNPANASGATYVAYLFAHNAGGFGASGSDNVISCGSYTGNGSTTGPVINLGWEPQWILLKPSTVVDHWNIIDNMRGATVSGSSYIYANGAGTEGGIQASIAINATGFQPNSSNSGVNGSGQTYIYIAIRRGPMKTPTTGTQVFNATNHVSGEAAGAVINTGFSPDIVWLLRNGSNRFATDRLLGNGYMELQSTGSFGGIQLVGYNTSNSYINSYNGIGNHISYSFQRAPSFFDVVCYTGTGSATTFSHNLTVVPELMIVKRRDSAGGWIVYYSGLQDGRRLILQGDIALTAADSSIWNDTAPTSSNFTVGSGMSTLAATYVAYLFATLTGVSKVGSYTGTGTTNQINCGFTAGARFVLIKRTDSTGDWYVWDTTRGIVSGNDPYLLLNSTGNDVTNTDYIDPLNAGFEISSTAPAAINANGGTFIFLAIA